MYFKCIVFSYALKDFLLNFQRSDKIKYISVIIFVVIKKKSLFNNLFKPHNNIIYIKMFDKNIVSIKNRSLFLLPFFFL